MKLTNLKELNPYLNYWEMRNSKHVKKVKSYKDDEDTLVEIFHVETLDTYIKFELSESSYTGEMEVDRFSFVEEKDITVTEYLNGNSTASDIIEKIEELGNMSYSALEKIGYHGEPLSVYNFGMGSDIPNKLPLGIGEWEEVHKESHMGEEYISVKYFKDHGVYIKTEGYTSSYDKSVDFESGYGTEVKPVMKNITTYS